MKPQVVHTFIRYVLIATLLLAVSSLEARIGVFHSLAASAYQHLANVASMSASVPPNPYNTLALELTQKEDQLAAREAALNTREASLDRKIEEAARANRTLTLLILGGVTVFLLLLILLNFYYDVKREEVHEHTESHKDSGLSTTL